MPINSVDTVVVIVADSLRRDAEQGAPLPFIRRHAIDFSRAYSPGCWTGAVYGSLSTGLPPNEHGLDVRWRKLSAEQQTLAEQASAAGWKTTLITANGVPAIPAWGLRRGFEEVIQAFDRMPWSPIDLLFYALDWQRVRETIAKRNFIALESKANAGKAWLRNTHKDVMIETLKRQRQSGKRFISINLMETHFPYHISDSLSFLSEGLGKLDELLALYHLVSETWLHTDHMTISREMLAVLRERARMGFQHIASAIDAFVEELMADGKTAVIFLSDHGDAFGEDNKAYHVHNVTVGGNHVPFYILLPGGRGQIDAGQVNTMDLYGTVLELMGISSNSPSLLGERRSPVTIEAYYKEVASRNNQEDQFCWHADDLRLLHRGNRWHQARLVASGMDEPVWERFDGDPIEETLSGEDRETMRQRFANYLAYSSQTSHH